MVFRNKCAGFLSSSSNAQCVIVPRRTLLEPFHLPNYYPAAKELVAVLSRSIALINLKKNHLF